MNILIADDHELVREGLCLLVKRLVPDSVISEAGNFHELETLTRKTTNWGLIIIDLTMPGNDGLKGVNLVMANSNSAPVIVISASEDTDDIKAVLAQGVKGYIPKSATAELMSSAIKLVLAGGHYLPDSVLDLPASGITNTIETSPLDSNIPGLTKRQSDVAFLLTEGKANKVIGRELNMSEATVRTHMTAIFRTMEVNNRTQAVIAISKLLPIN